ncbi:MAG: hypothetical protein KQI35_17425 [Bacteroidetes bacterium]|nr:hypothetical protein [Bacteroidota bacterium]
MERMNIPGEKAENFWLPLDNAAKIFPAVITDELTAVFRISVVLNNRINIRNLLLAVDAIKDRFPYYQVRLKKGFFWYYLEYADLEMPVEFDCRTPCRNFTKDGFLFRILAVKNRLSVEFSHILTDGSGAFEFLKSLLIIYLKEGGIKIPEKCYFHRPDEIAHEEEFEDSYSRYFKVDIPPMLKQSKAFHLPFSLNDIPRFDVLNAIISKDEIKAMADGKDVNITVYLTAVYLFVLQEVYQDMKIKSRYWKDKWIRLQVPIDLRKIYQSKSMRNFSLYVMPGIDMRLGHYSFDEIIKTVFHQMQLETDEKLVNKNIARNVGSEKKLLVRSIPLFLKSFILSVKYYSLGTSQYSGVLTNLGNVILPAEINKCIKYFIVTPPPPNKKLKVNCGIIGFKDNLILSFGNITKSKELEKRFLKFLVDQGLKVKLTTYKTD